MKRFALASAALCLLLLGAGQSHAQQTKNPQVVSLFREVVARPSQSTVRVLVNGKDVALGAVVGADGWVVTVHGALKGAALKCRFADGQELEAKLVGFDVPHDLAVLRVEADGLTPVDWADSKVARVGHWVASPGTGKDPVAIGVVSVAAREIKGAKFMAPSGAPGGYLGIQLDLDYAGVKVQEVVKDAPAQKAGLKADDLILSINGQKVENADEFLAVLTRHAAGAVVTLKVERGTEETELKITLGQRPGTKGGKSRGELQNSMGSKLSDRRTGYPHILQHDSVLLPGDCGGPLVNLDGKTVGINVSRAGRTESYAIPTEVVRPLLERLKAGSKTPLNKDKGG
jgi:serine protease Do